MSYRMKTERTEQAKDAAHELVSWLEDLRRLPDVGHEVDKCAREALGRARRVAAYIDEQWILEPVLSSLPSPPSNPGGKP